MWIFRAVLEEPLSGTVGVVTGEKPITAFRCSAFAAALISLIFQVDFYKYSQHSDPPSRIHPDGTIESFMSS
jgi:hypothetical protein